MLPDLAEAALVACAGIVVWSDEMVFNECVCMRLYALVCGPREGEHVDFVEGDCSAVLRVCVPW